MKVKNELKRLAILEGFNSIFFIVVYFIIIKSFDTQFTFIVFYPLLCCSIILLQAAIYWIICLMRINDKLFCIHGIKHVYKGFRLLDLILLLIYPLILLLSEKTTVGLLISLSIYIFAIIEYINYFYIRLSYPIPLFIKKLKKMKFTMSRIAKEINS